MPFTHVHEKRIHYSDSHPPSSPPRQTLVLLHGLGSSQNFWYPIIPELTENGFRCVALDYPGAGRSSYTQVEQSLDSLAKAVVGLLDQLSIPKAVVVGHSMSGMIGAYLAATYQERFVAAILIGSVYPGPEVSAVFEKRIAAVEAHGMDAMAETVPNVATSKTAHPLVRSFIRELLLGSSAAGYISNCRIIANAKPVNLGAIKIPTLVIAGDEDYATPADMNRKVFNELGTVDGEKKWVLLEKTGHWIVVEKPDEVARHILDFITGIQKQ